MTPRASRASKARSRAPEPGGAARLQKVLAQAGVASRRASEALIRDGRVTVNGSVVTEMGVRVDPAKDRVRVDGKPIAQTTSERHVLFHKPRGVITTRKDPRGRKTVYDLLDEGPERLVYVGRLDRDAEGLLLFTSDGELAHRLMHPSYGIPREYRVWVEGAVDVDRLRRAARSGLDLEDGRTAPFEVAGGPGEWRLVLREGKSHEVKRIFAAVGGSVVRLRRVRLGNVVLGDLRPGRSRPLSRGEIRALRRLVGLASYGQRRREAASIHG